MNFLPDNNLKSIMDLQMTSKDGKALVPALVNFLNGFQTTVTKILTDMKEEFVNMGKAKDEEILSLRNEVKSLRKDFFKLEEKIEENEAYERRDTLIFSGKKLPVVQNGENCSQVVCKLLADNASMVVSSTDMSVAHRLGPKPNNQTPDTRPIIVKFCRRETKVNILSSVRRAKPANLFANESLTPTRQKIAMALRKAKRVCPSIVSGSTTIDGSIYVWTKPANPNAHGARDTKMKINTFARLEDFCTGVLHKPITDFLLN